MRRPHRETAADASPRTDAEPMAATREEVLRGALWALFAFNVLLLVVVIAAVTPAASEALARDAGYVVSALWLWILVVGTSAIVGLGVSMLVVLAGLPVAWALSRRLRRVRSVAAHLWAWAALGAAIGLLALLVFAIASANWSTAFLGPLLPITLGVTTSSVLFGWWRASRHARRALPPAEPRSPIGIDEAFEDAL
ncbi:hypothetical protein ACFT30_17015 [Microbacterium ureisolvens]|uniref:hypothetical protein n=1 Tax=Microbacterium ureisolvens TaxID=2781186 RepID=UPI00363268E4